MPRVIINVDLCKACGICLEFCPVKILKFSDKVNRYGYRYVVVTDESKCVLCNNCVRLCPDFAIYVIK